MGLWGRLGPRFSLTGAHRTKFIGIVAIGFVRGSCRLQVTELCYHGYEAVAGQRPGAVSHWDAGFPSYRGVTGAHSSFLSTTLFALTPVAWVRRQTNYSAYPVDFHYSSDKPLASDMLLDMPDMGFRVRVALCAIVLYLLRQVADCGWRLQLRFEPLTQRLRLIDVYDTKRVVMTYHGSSWSGPTTDSTFIRVYDVSVSCRSQGMPGLNDICCVRVQLFGPTFPGKLDAGRGVRAICGSYQSLMPLIFIIVCGWLEQDYFLHYRGLSFTFHIPQEYRSLYGSSNDMPLELPVRCTVTRRALATCVLTTNEPHRRTTQHQWRVVCSSTAGAICCGQRCRLPQATTASL